MNQKDVLIKWTGSKRLQSSSIIKYFPNKIKTYYEPFLGGGSMLHTLTSSSIEVDNLECSDINDSLIGIWKMIKDSPNELFDFYNNLWPFSKDKYYSLRNEFNQDHDPKKFFCILRTCRNGLVRYNKKNEFTSAFHLRRKGINPENLFPVMMDWSSKIQNVKFVTRDYREIKLSSNEDFIYLDPPYAFIGDFYYGMIDFDQLWKWMDCQEAKYVLSLNGTKNDKDCTIHVPNNLFNEHVLIDNGYNKYDQLNGNLVKARDSLYISG